jgi:hypothetical protein
MLEADSTPRGAKSEKLVQVRLGVGRAWTSNSLDSTNSKAKSGSFGFGTAGWLNCKQLLESWQFPNMPDFKLIVMPGRGDHDSHWSQYGPRVVQRSSIAT